MNPFEILALLLVLAGIVYSERLTLKTILLVLAAVAFLLGIFAPKLL